MCCRGDETRFEALSAYRDDMLSLEERNKVEAHLKECEVCRKTLLQMEEIAAAMAVEECEVPAEVTERWKAAVKKERRSRARRDLIRPLSTLAAALVLAVAGSVMAGNHADRTIAKQRMSVEVSGVTKAEENGAPMLRMAPAPAQEEVPQVAAFSLELEDEAVPLYEAARGAREEVPECAVCVYTPEGEEAETVYNIAEGYVLGCGAPFRYEERGGQRGMVCELGASDKEGLLGALAAIGCQVEADEGGGRLFLFVQP